MITRLACALLLILCVPTVSAQMLPNVLLRCHVSAPSNLGLKLKGLQVRAVKEKSLAKSAGMKKGDTIERCGSAEVSSWGDVVKALQSDPYLAKFELTVKRGKKQRSLKFDLLRKRKLTFAQTLDEIACPLDIGLLVSGNGLTVSRVLKRSPAVKAKIKKGDLITKILEVNVKDWTQTLCAIEHLVSNTVKLRLKRGSKERVVTLKLSNKVVSTSGGKGGDKGHVTKEIKVGGVTRKYELKVPKWVDKDKPAPLVVLLHGMGGTPKGMFGAWEPVAGKEAILAAPMGARNWRSGNKTDDALVERLLANVEKAYNVNLSRVYVTGFSQGGFYTYSLGITNGGYFAAAGIHSAGPSGLRPDPKSKSKCPFIFIHAKGDKAVPIAASRAAVKVLKAAGHEVKFIEKKGIAHRMDTEGITSMWEFFKKHKLAK